MTKRFEKEIEIGGQKRVLTFGFEAIVKVEHELDRGIFQVVDNLGFRELSAVFWAMLSGRDPGITIEEADKLADKLDYDDLVALILGAVESYFPTAASSIVPVEVHAVQSAEKPKKRAKA